MGMRTATLRKPTGRRTMSESGQAALVLVIAFTVMLTIFGGVMVTTIVNNSPIVAKASIQRYAYRALASGLNAYLYSINANPYLAACNTTNAASSVCAGVTYQTWSQVAGTDAGNGVVPELYKFDNPQQVTSTTNGPITELEVQITGAAGFPGNYAYYSTVAHFTPQNGFLNHVWWSNYESSDFSSANPNAANCNHFWDPTVGRNTGNLGCDPVQWQSGDQVYGPVFSNDSLYTSGSPTFSPNPDTADPQCLYVSGSNYNTCTTDTPKTYGQPLQKPPVTNAQLGATAIQGGCYYTGPTTISFKNDGTMTVKSIESPGYPGLLTQSQPSTNTNYQNGNCPTNGNGGFPSNGVVYVDAANCSSCTSSNNPFYSSTTGLSQLSNCGGGNCYYQESAGNSPSTEGDAFVGDLAGSTGGFSGHLTVAANNNVIIDSPIIYKDCTWATPAAPSESACQYNDATLTKPNDVLGLIANNFVEVNRPLYNDNASNGVRGTPLPDCGAGQLAPPPLCDAATSTASPTGGPGLTIDAAILALNQSFVVNNYGTSGAEGTLGVYGSIEQNSRGPVGLVGGTGFYKFYTYDPRLPLYSPPYYLTPGTASWALDSSAESYNGKCPSMPPAQKTPAVQAAGTDLTFPISGSTACTGP